MTPCQLLYNVSLSECPFEFLTRCDGKMPALFRLWVSPFPDDATGSHRLFLTVVRWGAQQTPLFVQLESWEQSGNWVVPTPLSLVRFLHVTNLRRYEGSLLTLTSEAALHCSSLLHRPNGVPRLFRPRQPTESDVCALLETTRYSPWRPTAPWLWKMILPKLERVQRRTHSLRSDRTNKTTITRINDNDTLRRGHQQVLQSWPYCHECWVTTSVKRTCQVRLALQVGKAHGALLKDSAQKHVQKQKTNRREQWLTLLNSKTKSDLHGHVWAPVENWTKNLVKTAESSDPVENKKEVSEKAWQTLVS